MAPAAVLRPVVVLALASCALCAKLRVSTVGERPSPCPVAAAHGDELTVHYRGKLKDGSVFEETYKIGRPTTFTLGAGSVIKGWEQGLPGACVGETRRLVVPPSLGYGEQGKGNTIPPKAALTFEVEVVAINGKHLHEVLAEADAQGAPEGAAADPLARDAGRRGSPMCDACEAFVEKFFEGWVKTMMHQQRSGKVEQKDGGSRMPAITYNDETEAYVQGFCRNRTSSAFTAPSAAQHLLPGCERIMLARKREIVGRFLSAELAGRNLPAEKDKICGEWLKSCDTPAYEVRKPCEACRATVGTLAFERRLLAPASKEVITKHIRNSLDALCTRMSMRHTGKWSLMQETCDDLMDEYGEALVDFAVSGAVERDFAQELCVERAGLCDKLPARDEL